MSLSALPSEPSAEQMALDGAWCSALGAKLVLRWRWMALGCGWQLALNGAELCVRALALVRLRT